MNGGFARQLVARHYSVDRARQAGISPGFLTVVLEENVDDLLDVALRWAKQAGEFGCAKCGRYFTRVEARVEGDVPLCPYCGEVLEGAACGICGRPLYGERGWEGLHVAGFSVCRACRAQARRQLAQPEK